MSNNSFSPSFPAKAAVIIDGGYWRVLVQNLGVNKLDLVSLSDYLCKPAYRVRTHFFDGKVQENQSFHDSLRLMDRFDVTLGDVVPRDFHCPHCNERFTVDTQKRVDVALAVELVHLATSKHVDSIVLIAGDRDFLPAITAAKHAGVIVRLVHGPQGTVSDLLYQTVDERIELTKKYLQTAGITFKSASEKPSANRVKATKPAVKEPKTAKEATPGASDLLSRICADYFARTSKQEILLSTIGDELKQVEPGWRKKYGTKTLKDLIALGGDKFEVKKIHKTEVLVPLETGKPVPKQKEAMPLQQFLLDTLGEYFTTHKDKKLLTGPQLGALLLTKDKNWKKTYKTKQLTDALAVVQEKVTVAGTGPKMTIGLK